MFDPVNILLVAASVERALFDAAYPSGMICMCEQSLSLHETKCFM
jgi:hypothetical protein